MTRKKVENVSKDFWDNKVNKKNKKWIDEFLNQQYLSPRTMEQYRSALQIFAKWVYDETFDEDKGREKLITELKPRHAMLYQNWLASLGLAGKTIRFKRSVVSSLCDFIVLYYGEDYEGFRNIYSKAIKNVEVPKKEKNPLTKEEILAITTELEKRQDWQKLAYFWYTYATGCRREETRQLKVEVIDYDFVVDKKGNVKDWYRTHIIRAKGKGKTGKERRFDFDQRAMDAMKKWVEYRHTQIDGEDDCPYMFVSKKNGKYVQLSPNSFNKWCEKFGEIIGGKKVHPHLMRSTRATIMKQDGLDIKKIQKLLGHESSETTEIYIVSDDDDDMDGVF